MLYDFLKATRDEFDKLRKGLEPPGAFFRVVDGLLEIDRRARHHFASFSSHPLTDEPVERERQRDRLIGVLTALDQQIIALEAIRDEKNAASVVVDGVTEQEVKTINAALAALHKVIQRTQTFQANLALLTAALGEAAKTIGGAGSRGTAA